VARIVIGDDRNRRVFSMCFGMFGNIQKLGNVGVCSLRLKTIGVFAFEDFYQKILRLVEIHLLVVYNNYAALYFE
jgi:hypothetical protein